MIPPAPAVMIESAEPERSAPTGRPRWTAHSERNVLRLMARGAGNTAIAAELSISHKTVRNYVSSIFRKLQVESRSEAIVRARDARFHEPG